MKIFNLLFLVTIIFILSACQARNMPMHHDMKLKKKTIKIKHKKKSIRNTIVRNKVKQYKVKQYKVKPVIQVKPKKYKQKPIKVKAPLKKQKNVQKYFPTPTKTDVTNTLPTLPTLPSIEKIKNSDTKKHYISNTQDSDKIINSIALPTESFSGGGIVDNLDMGAIRIGRSPDYTSIIFDSYKYAGKNIISTNKSPISGTYLFTYEPSKNRIIAFIDGYNDFSALNDDQRELFKDSRVVKNIYVLKHIRKDGIKFVIELRKKVRAKIFDVKNPGRIIVNLFPK